MSVKADSQQKGFSLVEVMVALAVLSMAGIALLNAMTQSVRATQTLQDQTLAAVVAENVMTQTYIERDQGRSIQGERGDYELAGRNFYWQLDVLPTPQPGIRSVILEIRQERDSPVLYQLRSFGADS